MDFTKLEKYLDILPELGIPVSDTAVTLGGKTVFRHSAGYADAETKRPITNDDLYYVFSVSKITACVAAMRLVELEPMSAAVTTSIIPYIRWYAT